MSFFEIDLHLSADGDRYKAELFESRPNRPQRLAHKGCFSLRAEELLLSKHDVAGLGRRLSELLFHDAGLETYWRGLMSGLVPNGGEARFRLTFVEEGRPEKEAVLQSACWEALLDPAGATALANQEQLPMSRRILVRHPASRGHEPHLSPWDSIGRSDVALVIAATGAGLEGYRLPKIDVEPLSRRLATSWGGSRTVRLGSDGHEPASEAGLLRRLRQIGGPVVLCLICHGGINAKTGEAFFWLEGEHGGDPPKRVLAQELCDALLSLERPPLAVILASCSSAGDDSYANAPGAAGSILARRGIPAVLAMRGEIGEASVRSMLPIFLEELATTGAPELALAVARKREREEGWRATLWFTVQHQQLWRAEPPEILAPFFQPPEAQPIMAGRADELRRARQALVRGGAIIITGQSGVGKSALARALCAELSGRRVLWAELTAEKDGWGLLVALARELWSVRREQASRMLEAEEERERLYAELERGSRALVLDGLEQVGEDKWPQEVLDRLGAIAARGGLLMIVTGERAPKVPTGMREIALEPLDQRAVERWCAREKLRLGEEDLQALWQKTEGLAHYLGLAIGYLKRLAPGERPAAVRSLAAQQPIRDDLNDKVFEVHKDSHRDVLLMLGVLDGAPMTTGGLTDLLGHDVSEVVAQLEAVGHLRRHPETGHLSMHTLLRQEAVRRSQDQGTEHHRRQREAARYYEGRAEHAYWAMAMYLGAGMAEEALKVAARSLTDSKVILPPQATRALLDRLRSQVGEQQILIDTLLAEACLHTGEEPRIVQAETIFGTILGRVVLPASPFDRLCIVRAYDRLALIAVRNGQYREARDRLDEGRHYLDEVGLTGDSAALAADWLRRSEGLVAGGEGRRRAELAELEDELRAWREAILKGDAPADERVDLARNQLALATDLAELGEYRKAEAYFDETITLRRELGQLDLLGNAHVNYSNFFSARHMFEEAHRHLDEAERLADAHDLPLVKASVLNTRGSEHYEQGELGRAAPLLEQALWIYGQLHASLGSYAEREQAKVKRNVARGRFDCCYRLAAIALARGDAAAASAQVERALGYAHDLAEPDRWRRLCAVGAQAEVLLLGDDPDTAETRLEEVWRALLERRFEDPSDICRFFAARAKLRRRQGRLAEAVLDAQAGLTYARRSGSPFLYESLRRQCEELYQSGA